MRLLAWTAIATCAVASHGQSCFPCPAFSTSKVDCPRSFADCECMPNARRLVETCACNLQCPHGGSPADPTKCPISFEEDCSCQDGFIKLENSCSCPYRCPAKSTGPLCPTSFEDCTCIDGFVKGDGVCEECPFACPLPKVANHSDTCPQGPDDCICPHGYVEEEDASCRKCFECPRFSIQKSNVTCATSMDDCDCVPDSNRLDYGCTCKNLCPHGSDRIYLNYCPTGFQDCKCKPNFIRDEELQKCICEFQCPPNSRRESDFVCPVAARDCACEEGFRKDGEGCVWCVFQCPANSFSNLTCTTGFQDCTCAEGFVRGEDSCNPPWTEGDTTFLLVGLATFWVLLGLFRAVGATFLRGISFLLPWLIAALSASASLVFASSIYGPSREEITYVVSVLAVLAAASLLNLLLTCLLVSRFRAGWGEECSEEDVSFSDWTMQVGNEKTLGLVFFSSLVTVESLNVASSHMLSAAVFRIPLSRKQKRRILAFAAPGCLLQNVGQIIILVKSRQALDQVWSRVAVFSLTMCVISILNLVLGSLLMRASRSLAQRKHQSKVKLQKDSSPQSSFQKQQEQINLS